MKRIVAIIAALVMLIGAVPGVADDKGFIDTMQEVNDNTKTFYALCIEELISVHDAGADSDVLAICMHYYMTMYNASRGVNVALSMLQYSVMAPENEMMRSGEQRKTALEKAYAEQYDKYVNGEISASEYMEKMKSVYESGKKAAEEAQKYIDEINKKNEEKQK